LYNGYLDLGRTYSLSGRFVEAFEAYRKPQVLVASPIDILRDTRELDPDHIREIWHGAPYLVLQDFEASDGVQLRHWTMGSGWLHRSVDHRLSSIVSSSGQWSEFIGVDYGLEPDSSVVDRGRLNSYLYDYWAMDVSIPKPTIPIGIRALVRAKRGNTKILVCLVVGYLTRSSSSTVWSEATSLTKDWTALTVKFPDSQNVKLINKIGVGFLGTAGMKDRDIAEIYVDDIQIFSYTN
jgi:hypothetical protein